MSGEENQEKFIAYFLVVTEIRKEYEVRDKIRKIGQELGVNLEAYVVYGEYDIAGRIETDSLKKIDKVITEIRGIPGVLRTVTLIASS